MVRVAKLTLLLLLGVPLSASAARTTSSVSHNQTSNHRRQGKLILRELLPAKDDQRSLPAEIVDGDTSSVSAAMLAYHSKRARVCLKLWRRSKRRFQTGKGGPTAVCPFSEEPPKFKPWADPAADRFDAFWKVFSDVGLVMGASGGTLLGAYRHHGTIPYDMDMDTVFDLCENRHILDGSGSRLAGMSCDKVAALRDDMGKKAFHGMVWDEVLEPLLRDRGVAKVEVVDYGIRLSNGLPQWNGGLYEEPPAGVGMDLSIDPGRYASKALCKCTYGTATAYCPLDSADVLRDKDLYGEDFMTPKSQCDFYAELAEKENHDNWNARSASDCNWTKDAAL